MNWPNNPYVMPALLGAILTALLADFTRRRHPAPGALPAALAMLAVSVWCWGYTFELASGDLQGRLFWSKFEYFGIVSIPLAWFAFALDYTGHKEFWSRHKVAAIAVIPLLTLALVWTNDSHGLFWSRFELDTQVGFVMSRPTRNIGFYINWTFAYVLLLSSTVLFLRWLVRSPSLYRRQAAVLMVATLAPWAGNFVSISGLSPFPRLDLTPLAFVASSAILALGLYRYRLFDIVPVAQDKVIENMPDAVLVLDAQNRIVNANPAAHALLGLDISRVIGENAASLFSAYGDLNQQFQNIPDTHTEITRGTGEDQRWLDLRISALRTDHLRRLNGRVLVLRDITRRKQTEQELERLAANLQSELAERKRAQDALRVLNDELELRVALRTAELERANEALKAEIDERRKAQEENLRRAAQLEALRQTTLELTAQLDVTSLLTSISQRAVELMGATTSSFYIYRPERDLLERVVVSGPYLVNSALTRRRGEGLIGRVWETNTAIYVNDYNSWSRRNGAYDDAPSRAVMGIPIHWGERFLGVVTIVANRPRTFGGEDVELLKLFADQAAVALENARLYDQAQQEIADRKRAEEAIRLSEARYRSLVETQADIVSRSDLGGKLSFVNDSFCRVFGIPREQALGMDYRPSVFPEDLPIILEAMAAIKQPPYRKYVEIRNITPGGIRWFGWDNSSVLDGQGNIVELQGVGRDITERKRAEEERQKLAALVESTPDFVALASLNGQVEYINKSGRALVGLTDAQASGLRVSQFVPPADVSRVEAILRKVMQEGHWLGEGVLRNFQTGRITPAQIQTFLIPHPETRQPIAIGTVMQDITERKRAEQALRESEERFRRIVETAREGIFAFDADWKLSFANARFAEILGYEPRELQGRPIRDFILEVDLPAHETRKARRMAGVGGTTENMYRARSGAPVWLLISSSPILEHGKFAGSFGMVTDITERKRREHELESIAALSAALRVAETRAAMLPVILNQSLELPNVEGAALAIRNRATGELETELGWGKWANFTGAHLSPEESLGGRVMVTGKPCVSNAIEDDPLLAPPALIGELNCIACVPLTVPNQTIGALWVGRRTPIPEEEVRLLTSIADIAANAIHRATLFEQTQKAAADLELAYDTTLEGWARALELRDHETEGHARRVVEMTVALAQAMGIREGELETVRRGALLHDIGKMGVPDAILLKPGPLDDREWEIMKRHTEYARDLLAPIDYLRKAIDIPYSHHEKWDGSGYPCGLRGEAIPLAARIFAIVDVWDALRSDRPYRRAWSADQVVAHLKAQAGKHFDPQVVAIFLRQIAVGV